MKCAVTTLAVAILFINPPDSFAACGRERVSVSGSAEEMSDACRALDEVVHYFEDLGFIVEPKVRIVFLDQVFLKLGNEATLRVSGSFDPVTRQVQITSWNSESQTDRKPWGITWDRLIGFSVLQHELTHMAVEEIRGTSYGGFGRAWREFIAYTVQFTLMDRNLRAAVLHNYPDMEPFDNLQNVNPVIHGFDPDAFGVRAYLYAEANGGAEFIRRILHGEFEPETGAGNFLFFE